MSEKQAILRVDATYDLMVKIGDVVRQGERLSRDPSQGTASTAPMTGVIRSIRFDPRHHEFVVVIADAQ